MPWVALPEEGTRSYEGHYERPEGVWSEGSVARMKAVEPDMERWYEGLREKHRREQREKRGGGVG